MFQNELWLLFRGTLAIWLFFGVVFWSRPGGIMGVTSIYLSKIFMPIWAITYSISFVIFTAKLSWASLLDWWVIAFFVLNGLLIWFFVNYIRKPDRVPLSGIIDHGGYKVHIIGLATLHMIIETLQYTEAWMS